MIGATFAASMLLASVASSAVNEPLPVGRYACEVSVGEEEGKTLVFDRLVSGVQIVDAATFANPSTVSELTPVDRMDNGNKIEGVQFEALKDSRRVQIDLNKITRPDGSFYRVWIMKQVGEPQSRSSGGHILTDVGFAFSAAGRCLFQSGNQEK